MQEHKDLNSSFGSQKRCLVGIRPSKVMGTSWIGEKFMDKILYGRLKLLEDEK